MKNIILSVFFGLASATNPSLYYGGSAPGYVQTLPPRVTSLTMSFPYGNPFRPGENFVDLGRTGPYYLGNGYRGYMLYPTYGISNAYHSLFGGGSPFGGNFGGGLIGGNFGGGPYGGYPTNGLLGGNLGGILLGGNLGGGLLGGNLGGGIFGRNLGRYKRW